MSGESNADVYASLGASSAVMTGSTVEEHEQAMLALDVDTRDGDDQITLSDTEVDLYDTSDKFADPNEDTGFIQVRIGTAEGTEPEVTEEGEQEAEADGEEGEDTEEFKPLGEAPKDLTEASEQLAAHEVGFQEMIAQATERGLTAEAIDRIQAEYADEGISEQSYEELAAAGYSKSFINSYIAGQEAMVDAYVNQVIEYAGGRENFASLHEHLKTSNPEAAVSLEVALENRDIATLKGIINLAGAERQAKFGRKSERTVTARATPAKPAPVKAEGFASQAEMIKAMNDPRYRHNEAYRREVEQKVIDSKF